MEDTITISREKYNELMLDSVFLSCLRAAGLDNWSGYSEAQEMFEMEDED